MKNSNHKKRIHITTLGCSKNVYDSEILMGQLKNHATSFTEEPEESDTIIINTCGFIHSAKQESINAILEAVSIKKRNPSVKVLVAGCLSARYQKNLQHQIPEVDGYFGTEDYQRILQYLNLPVEKKDHLYQNRLISKGSHWAFLKISEGCNHQCAFCAIPLMRGQHRSRPMDQILSEAQLLSEKGIKEVILVAQDTTFYGVDLYNRQCLIDLIQDMEKIEGIKWIRLHYAYPTTFPDELVSLMQRSQKMVHYVDIPIQHISDRMLKLMRRGGDSRQIKGILYHLRKNIPDVVIRTTLLVGHPGERQTDFDQLKSFIQEFQFNRLGIFIYSPEESTAAFRLKAPSREVAENRYAELMKIQQAISRNLNEKHIGKTLLVLVDSVNSTEKIGIGRTYGDSPEIDNEVVIQNIPNNIQSGNFYAVKILDAGEYELFGQIEED